MNALSCVHEDFYHGNILRMLGGTCSLAISYTICLLVQKYYSENTNSLCNIGLRKILMASVSCGAVYCYHAPSTSYMSTPCGFFVN